MKKSIFLSMLLLLCLPGFLPRQAGLAAAAVKDGPLAILQVTSEGLLWQPLVETAGWSLKIVGADGPIFEKSFAAGEQPFFALKGAGGKPLMDGIYNYELWGTPAISEEVKAQLNAAEEHSAREALIEKLQKTGVLPSHPLRIAGSFTLLGGVARLPDPEAVESPAPLTAPLSPDDYEINDDLIVLQNACIGAGCASGMVWSYAPLTLKTSLVRLLFDDTSTSVGFADNDWAILINDSLEANGEYFAVQDYTASTVPFKLMAGAPNNAIFVDADGDVGFGTSTPTGELQVTDESEPSLFLEQKGGVEPEAKWSVNGSDTSFTIWDDTHYHNPFIIEADAPSNSIRVAIDGNVGIGTISPAAKLHVAGDLQVDGFVNERSDRAAKTDFAAVDGQDVLQRLASIPITTWSYKDAPEVRHIGPMAQDFRLTYNLGTDDKHIAALDTNGVALAAIQALNTQMNEKDARIADLQARLNAVETRNPASPMNPLFSLLLGLVGGLLGAQLKRKK